jgi:hypothetical protein
MKSSDGKQGQKKNPEASAPGCMRLAAFYLWND